MTKEINQRALSSFRKVFSGTIILPQDREFDKARRVFNAMIDRRPGIIAQPSKVTDVMAAVKFGRELGLEIAVRGGGHSVSGKSLTEGGLVIDLRHLNQVTVDPDARTAKVEGGATISHLDRATQPFGLATTGGRVSTTGVGGFTLGGGSGWFDRKFGLACDNLLSVELVTADGEIVHANEEENPDLFWALHGGGGNFGVATSFTFHLYELSTVTVIQLFWHPDDAYQVLRHYRDFMQVAPVEVSGGVSFITAGDEDFIPESLRGGLVFGVTIAYAGQEAEALDTAAPLLAMGHAAERIEEMAYADFQCSMDDQPGYRNYWSAEYLESLPDQAVEKFCSRSRDMIVPSPSQHVLYPQGGAVDSPSTDYPIPWRHAAWAVHPFGQWQDPAQDERGRRWAHNVVEDLKPWSSGSVYLNYIGDEGEDRTVGGFGSENYRKLAEIKGKYDPENVFHLNHNIQPA